MEKRQIFTVRAIKMNEEDSYIVTCGDVMFSRENTEEWVFKDQQQAQNQADSLNNYIDWDIIGTVATAIAKAEIRMFNRKNK
jgi:antirestriction protein